MKTKEIILKESHNTDEETLEHCLTAIQAMLDMDDFERAYDYLNGFVSEIIAQTREETIRDVEQVLDRQELIHKELETQWTGIKISPCGSELYSERPNPHREKREEIIKIKQILNKLKK